MARRIFIYGFIAGLIVVVPMFITWLGFDPDHQSMSVLTGYLIMLVALSMVFVGVKQRRDRDLGGVIKFVPAFLMGLGISTVAGIMYVIGWEITLAASNYSFASDYANAMLDAARQKGSSPEVIERLSAQMAAFREQYANPLFRLPMTFIEIFPVGVLVSLISAALLRNSRFMPARAAR